jgi:hypothetical protein
MKKDTELDNLLKEYQNLMNPKEDDFRIIKEDAMILAMSDKYGRKPYDREVIIKSLKENIERKKFKTSVYHALDEAELIKIGKKKAYPIDTLWDEL